MERIMTVNGYNIIELSRCECIDYEVPYPSFIALYEDEPCFSLQNSVCRLSSVANLIRWCNENDPSKPVCIVTTRGRGRNIHHDVYWFDSREEAKAFAANNLDDDDNVARYSIYGD